MVNSRLCEAARPQFQNSKLSFFKKLRLKMQNQPKTRLQHLSQTLPRFRDPAKIFQDPHFSRNHSIHLELWVRFAHFILFFWNINSQFSSSRLKSSTNWSVCWKIICYSRSKLSDIPYPRLSCLKTILLTVAHAYLLYRHECFTGKYTTCKIHKNYIQDASGLFSIISHVSLSMM